MRNFASAIGFSMGSFWFGNMPTDGTHLVYDRSEQQSVTDGKKSTYWLAHEEGMLLKEMERVEWKSIEYKDGNGIMRNQKRWVEYKSITSIQAHQTIRLWVDGAWQSVEFLSFPS